MAFERWVGFQQVLFRERVYLSDRSNEGIGQSEGKQKTLIENKFFSFLLINYPPLGYHFSIAYNYLPFGIRVINSIIFQQIHFVIYLSLDQGPQLWHY